MRWGVQWIRKRREIEKKRGEPEEGSQRKGLRGHLSVQNLKQMKTPLEDLSGAVPQLIINPKPRAASCSPQCPTSAGSIRHGGPGRAR